MANPTNEQLNPRTLVIPNYTTAIKETLLVEIGTLVYDTTLGKLNVCITARTTGAGAWEEAIAGVQQSTITDYTSSTTLTEPPTKAEVEAQLALIATAINTIIDRLQTFGMIA